MSDYIGVVTNIGQAKIAAAIGGTALNLTTIRVGDGNGAPITPNAAMTDLVRRVGNAYPIISSGRDPVNANHWRVTTIIPVEDGPFDIREIGVWDAAGDMIAVAKHVLVEKRSPAQGAAVELLTDIVFPVSETAQVMVQVAPAAQISIFQMLRAGFTVVESATVTAPPGNPALGRTHVVPVGSTGAWAGLAGMLVQWNGIVWVAVAAPVGFVVVDQSKGRFDGKRWLERRYDGWVPGISRLVQRQPGNYMVATVAGDTISLPLDPQIEDYSDIVGSPLRFLSPLNGIGPLNIDVGFGPLQFLWGDGSYIDTNDLLLGELVEAYFDGAAWRRMGGLSPTRVKELIRQARSANRVVKRFTASDTWTKTAGLLYATVAVLGGGASGGMSRSSTGTVFSGGGGGNGGYVEDVFTAAELPASVPVIVGVGGASIPAGTPSGGNNGGSSAFGILASASGGLAGNGAEDNYGTGGNGGFGTDTGRASLLRLSGTRGSDGFLLAGGTFPTQFSGFGRGGQGGFYVTPTSAALASGAGQAGIVVVTEYY